MCFKNVNSEVVFYLNNETRAYNILGSAYYVFSPYESVAQRKADYLANKRLKWIKRYRECVEK